ncbi:MAG TPA: RMD1 family protein [Deltaproteobacteria bacterium]|nr:RMD1 family protein [Deltaproteobacteria bacterium]
MVKNLYQEGITIPVSAYALGERIELKDINLGQRISSSPLTICVEDGKYAVLFRYGAVVLFNMETEEEEDFVRKIRFAISDPFSAPKIEEAEIIFSRDAEESAYNGIIRLQDSSVERLQIVADVLAKSVILSYYESSIAEAFDRVEPFAENLQKKGKRFYSSRKLLEQIGNALLIQHKMVGRVEVGENPDILWERPDLERLYARLIDEYELHDRDRALERKLDLISRTAETLLNLLQGTRSIRLELYIVILIVLELLISIFQMFLWGK